MKVFYSDDHDGHYVGVCSIVVAPDESAARSVLRHALRAEGLDPEKPFSFVEIDTTKTSATVVQNGDY